MGLTFQQSFYYAPEEIFLLTLLGKPIAIFEIPEDEQDKISMKTSIERITGGIIRTINIDELIREGYKILDE